MEVLFVQNRPEVKEVPSVKRLEVVEFLDDAKITPTSSKYKPKFLEYLCEKMSMKVNDVPKRIYSDIYKIIQFYRKSHSQIKTMINQHKIFFDADLKPICLNSKNMDPDLSEVELENSSQDLQDLDPEVSQNFIGNSENSQPQNHIIETTSLKRIDIVKHLDNLKIPPSSEEYSKFFIEFLCEKLSLDISKVPQGISHDIYLIKRYFKNSHYKIDRMIKDHTTFFGADLKQKYSTIQNIELNVEEIPSIKRLEIVKHLDNLKILPTAKEYSKFYVKYLCDKLCMKISELPPKIYTNIYNIKNYYKNSNDKIETMIKQHSTFFNADLNRENLIANSINKVADLEKTSQTHVNDEVPSMKRHEVVKNLADLNISPNTEGYSKFFIDYLCEKFSLKSGEEIPQGIYHDIYMIKKYYQDCKSSIDRMIKKHPKFFETDLKEKCLVSINDIREMPILQRFDNEDNTADSEISYSKNQFKEEIVSVKRLEVVKHLDDMAIKPTHKEYSKFYLEYLCEKLTLENSELTKKVSFDISKIKSDYKKNAYNFDRMIKSQATFFDGVYSSNSKKELKSIENNDISSEDSHMIYSPQTKQMKLCGKFIEIESGTNFQVKKCENCKTMTKIGKKHALKKYD